MLLSLSPRRFLSHLGLACALALSSGAASAQDAAELKKARAQFQQATELEQARNWTAALQAFREVGQVRMTPQVRFHIAVCEENLGRWVAALGGYELALVDADRVNTDFRDEVEENVRRLRARIPKLVIERGEGASAATIELDGVAVGDNSVGVEVPLDPGPHAVTAKAPNRKPFEANVSLKEEETTRVELTLEELPRDAVPTNVAAPPPPDKPPSKVVPFVIGGVGVASLIGSGVLFALRQHTVSKLEKSCPDHRCPQSQASRYDDLKFYHYGAQVTLGVGIAAVGTAGALLLLQRKKAEPAPEQNSAKIQLAPSLPLSAGAPLGATLSGQF